VQLKRALAALAAACVVSAAQAGPIIIAGTDADDHGSFNGTSNIDGWLFMQDAFQNLAPAVSNGNQTVVCIGCNAGQALNAFSSAFSQSTLNGTWSFQTLTSTTDITNFFANTGTINIDDAGIIYMPTVVDNIGGGIDDTQLAVVNANGAAINSFVAGGGGLFTQEQVNSSIGYGWLTSLLPGLSAHGDNDSRIRDAGQLNLTPAGSAAFPGLTDPILSNATPWHAFFEGNFGGLSTLVTGPTFSVAGAPETGAVVIGGGAGTVIVCGQPGQPACPTPEPDSLPLLGAGLLAAWLAGRRASRR
jgi:hypothetical protein